MIADLLDKLSIQTRAARDFNSILTVMFLEISRPDGPRQDTLRSCADKYERTVMDYLDGMMDESGRVSP